MPKNWHHFSAKEHAEFLKENGFKHTHTRGSHQFFVKSDDESDKIVQVIIGNKEKKRQSRKTMNMSIRHSGIPKGEYKKWIDNK